MRNTIAICIKCQGLLVKDPLDYEQWHCVNCGIRLWPGQPVNLPPFQIREKLVLVPLRAPVVRTQEDPEREAKNAYMRVYMRKYRRWGRMRRHDAED